MTSNDVPASAGAGASGGRRRALGRGPGAARVAPPAEPAPESPPEPAPEPAPEPMPEPESVPEPVSEPGPVPEPGSATDPEPVSVPGSASGPESGSDSESEPVSGRAPVSASESESGSAPEPESESGSEAVSGPAPGSEPGSGSGAGAVRAEGAAEGGGRDGGEPEDEAGDGVFKVRLSNFEGPFDLLLQLISKHKLDVTEVALSKVTDEFMAHIRAMGPDWDLDQTTEFLVVAATLLDLKAARLLPSAQVEDEADLALLEARDLLFARLLQYRAYKQIADIFNARLEEEARRHPRTVGLEPHHAELLPEVVISIGPEGFAKLAVKAMQPKPKPQVYVDHIHAPLVSVQEQAGIVVARLRELGEASFRTLVADTDDTLTVVARFLALLELYREKAVALEQETALGDLTVRWTGGEGDETPRVTDEFDRPPEEPEEPGEPRESKQLKEPKEPKEGKKA
ncbi:segregation and condensation protein A [Streptomyces sediminimaris]|uniref:segregation and condensation protein A n=1 Tax=Streptomyces sediminimaris TaxID=3383721 RepID=UPI003999743C